MTHDTELIRRSAAPEALEFPLHELDGPITPNELFFVRNHYDTPEIDASTWRLSVEGCVERPKCLGLDDLKSMPKVSVESVIECAGNGRASLDKPVEGLQWACGAVGNAVWSGVSVRTVLESVGLAEHAVDLAFEGADKGKVQRPPAPCGEVAYARSIPRDLALSGLPILAYEMNGEPLAPAHGFPVRLIVPGWYGAASVKWVIRMVALDHPFGGYYQTSDYSYWQVTNGLPELKPIGPMPVKSLIARPVEGASLSTGERVEICGAAWTGTGEVVGVEISVDGGLSWNEAKLTTPGAPGSWRLWSWEWDVDGPSGHRTILSRARDSQGRVQATERNWNCGAYVIDHSLPVVVRIE